MTNETLETILRRRSIKNFKQDQIKNEELNALLEAAKYAPSVQGKQPWHFTVVQNKELLNKINEYWTEKSGAKASMFYNSPTFIIVSAPADSPLAAYDCSAALENILIAAESIGLGARWISGTKFDGESDKALCEKLQIPAGNKVFACASVGYIEGDVPEAAPRKDNIVTILE